MSSLLHKETESHTMGEEVRTEQSWLNSNLRAPGGATAPTLVPDLKREAIARFNEIGFPTTRTEGWRYTNILPLVRTRFELPSEPGTAPAHHVLVPYLLEGVTESRLVFVDGHYVSGLSSLHPQSGVTIHPLSAVLAAGAGSAEQQQLGTHLGKYASFADNAFIALNTALITDGAMIVVSRDVECERPIHLLFVASDSEKRLLLPVRNLLVVEPGARASVIEQYVGFNRNSYFSSSVTEVECGDGAEVEHTKLQLEGEQAFHFAALHVRQGSKSNFTSNAISLGGRLVRNEISPVIDGSEINSFLNGFTVIGGNQHVDNTTVIDHAMPNSFSREHYKGVYGGSSTSVFSGTIIVRPDAQKTNAIQSNQSLLLTDEASVNTQPQLKIWADDVKCTHGATIGQLDEDALFYIRSRGISEAAARKMLIKAFASDVLAEVKSEPLRQRLDELVSTELEAEIGTTR